MKLIKGLLGLAISIVFLASSCFYMGTLSLEHSTSKEAVDRAIVETNAASELSNEIMTRLPGSDDGLIKNSLEYIIKSDSMASYFSAYLEDAIQATLRGDEVPLVDDDALTKAISGSFDELEASGQLGLSGPEQYLFDLAKDKIIMNIVSSLSSYLSQYSIDDLYEPEEQDEKAINAAEYLKLLNDPQLKQLSMILAALSFIAMFIILFRRGTWLRLSGFCLLLCGGAYALVSGILNILPLRFTDSDLLNRLILNMVHHGTIEVAVPALMAGGVLLGVGLIYKVIRIII